MNLLAWKIKIDNKEKGQNEERREIVNLLGKYTILYYSAYKLQVEGL